jgi:uncharacterized membrane protein YkoI
MGAYLAVIAAHNKEYALAINKALDDILSKEKKITFETQKALIISLKKALSEITRGRH